MRLRRLWLLRSVPFSRMRSTMPDPYPPSQSTTISAPLRRCFWIRPETSDGLGVCLPGAMIMKAGALGEAPAFGVGSPAGSGSATNYITTEVTPDLFQKRSCRCRAEFRDPRPRMALAQGRESQLEMNGRDQVLMSGEAPTRRMLAEASTSRACAERTPGHGQTCAVPVNW